MYLLLQMAAFLFTTFVLGIAVGYALWRSIGEREVIARYNAAEMRLAAHLARVEGNAGQARLTHRDPPLHSSNITPGMPHHLTSQYSAPHMPQQYSNYPAPHDHGADAAGETDRLRLEQHFDEASRSERRDFEAKQVALIEKADDTAFRTSEPAAEPRRADVVGKLG